MQVIRHYSLGESLTQFFRRSWWDVLRMRLAMHTEYKLSKEEQERTTAWQTKHSS